MNSFVRSFPNLRSFYHGSATRTAIYFGLFILIPGLIVGLFAAQAGRAALAAGEVPPGIYFSSTTDGAVGGVAFADEDILRFEPSANTWSLYFDGSDTGLGAADVDAFEVLDNGDILLSPDIAVTLPVAGAVDDSDIVRFTPTSTGGTTAGSYSLFVDGSDVELTTDAEDIDGIAFAPDGRLLISVGGKAVVTGITALDEDVIALAMTSEGTNTAGTWSLYLDGSDVGLSTAASEDIGGVWSNPATSEMHLSTIGNFTVTGAKGQASDIFTCAPGAFGDATACAFSLQWDGALYGFGAEVIDGLAVVPGVPGDPPTPTSTPTATSTPPPGSTKFLYLSSTTGGTAGGVTFADEDILRFDPVSDTWSMFFDGSDVGLGAVDVDAFELLANGDILLSPDVALTLPVVGAVDDSDIVRFVPNSTGDTTAGTYNLYFDGSDVELTTDAENIDGLAFTPDGRLLISVLGSATVTGPAAQALDEDLLAFTMTSEGTNTAGTWSLYFDGSDVGLSTTADEDVGGVWSDPATSELYLSTLGAFAVTGTSGQGSDVFICAPGVFGDPTSCVYRFYWDGAVHSFGPEVIDGLALATAGDAPTPTATATQTPTATPTVTPTATTPPTSGTVICGNINSNQTWTAAGSPYKLTCGNVTIPTGITVMVQEGAILKLSGSSILVNGTLLVQGTADSLVYITSYKDDSVGGDTNNDGSVTSPAEADWATIRIDGGGRLEMSYGVVRYGGKYAAPYNRETLSVGNGGTAVLDHVSLTHSYEEGVVVNLLDYSVAETAYLTVINSTIANNGYYGIVIYGAAEDTINASITDSNIQSNGVGGIVYSGYQKGSLSLENNTFSNNSSTAIAIDVGSASTLSLLNNTGNGSGSIIELIGTLSGDLVLDVNAGMPFSISYDLVIPAGSTMTIQPGVIFKQWRSTITVNGNLLALGTDDSPVVFTSINDDTVGGDTNGDAGATSPTKGDSGGIVVNGGGRLEMNHTIMRYGGSAACCSYYPPNSIEIGNGGTAVLDHVTLTESRFNGISVVLNDNSVAETATLEVKDSVITNSGSNGVVVAEGWHDTANITIANTTISGNSWQGVIANLYRGSLTLDNNILNNNNAACTTCHAVYFYGWGEQNLSASVRLTDNTGIGNNNNSIRIGGAINGNLGEGIPYLVNNGLNVPTGSSLTIRSGVIFKLSEGIGVNGTLSVLGTAENPTVFTSYKDDNVGGDTNNDGNATNPAPRDWRAINVYGGRLEMSHAIVRYGGKYTNYWDPFGTLNLRSGGALVLDHVSLTESYSDGVRVNLLYDNVETATLSVTNSTIANNGNYGIFVSSGWEDTFNASVNYSSIYANSNGGIYYSGAPNSKLEAENNWWGASSGPAPYGSGNGINYEECWDDEHDVGYICDFYVDADPWVGKGYATNSQLGSSGPVAQYQAWEADPVNTANGNHAYSYTDLSIPTRGLPLSFTRSYNSLMPGDGVLGWGWRHTWEVSLVDSADGNVTVTFGDGHAEQWVWDGAQYVGRTGIFGRLTRNGDGSFDLAQKDHARYHFDPSGRLEWAEDRNGNRTMLGYDGGGKLTTVTAPDGRALTLAYSGDRLASVTDPGGRTVQFGHDVAGNLTAITDVRVKTTTAAYNADHRLLSMTDANNHTFVSNVFDSAGRVAEQRDGGNNLWTFVYSDADHLTIVTDPLGHTTTYTYDGEGRLITEKDALNQTESYAYDAAGNRNRVTDRRGYVTTMTYDGRGNLLTVTDPFAFVRAYTYDADDNLLTETDARSGVTTYAYNANHNPTSLTDALNKTTTFTYTPHGQLASVTDPLNRTTTYAYNANGDRTSTTDALGDVSSATYDNLGRMLTATDPLNHTTTYTYNAANHILTVTDAIGGVTSFTYDDVGNRLTVTDPRNGVTSTAYDNRDKVAAETNALSQTVTYTYDAVGNLTAVKDPLNHVTEYTYDALTRRTSVRNALGQTTTYTYDAAGNNTTVTDARTKTTTYTYDARNQLTRVTDAAGGMVSYLYDGNGNRTRMTDANGHITTYAYDALNRLVSVTDPLNHVTGYAYDAAGNRTGKTKADGTVLSYTFDDLNRLTGISAPGLSVAYTYDAAGNRLTMTDATGTTTYTYDDLDRVTAVNSPNGLLGYGYDANGNRTSLTYPGGNAVTYAYDAANRLASFTDWGGRVTIYTYDDAGRQTAIGYSNGVAATYTYDNADRLTGLSHVHPTQGTIAAFTYTLDNVGNRLTMVDADGATAYTYDNLNRLTRVVYPGGEAVDYTYDPMGNRLSLTSSASGATNYTYDAADRLLTAGATTFTWDDNGNMTGKGGAIYTWDALDRLAGITDGPTVSTYAYNGDGARVGKGVNGVATQYVQDVAAPLPLVLAEMTAGQTSRFVYGNDLVTQLDPAGTAAFYHPDGLGSTRALSNAAGARTDWYSYDIFGATRAHTGPSGQSFTFTGEQVDGESGLVFLRARYYSPVLGRFVSADSFAGFDQNGQSLNRFVYTENNPVRFVDPEGRSFWLEAAKFSSKYDKQIRTTADVIGLVPIAGGIWKDNILYATGKLSDEKLAVDLVVNTAGLVTAGASQTVIAGSGIKMATARVLSNYGTATFRNEVLYSAGLRTEEQHTMHRFIDPVTALLAYNQPNLNEFITRRGAISLILNGQVSLLDFALGKIESIRTGDMGQPAGAPKYYSGGGGGGGGW